MPTRVASNVAPLCRGGGRPLQGRYATSKRIERFEKTFVGETNEDPMRRPPRVRCPECNRRLIPRRIPCCGWPMSVAVPGRKRRVEIRLSNDGVVLAIPPHVAKRDRRPRRTKQARRPSRARGDR